MKKLFCSILSLALIFSLSACSGGNDSSEVESTAAHDHVHTEITEEDAVLTLYTYFGNQDKETGEYYAFTVVDDVMFNGQRYYHGRWSVLNTDENGGILGSTLRTEFFLSVDGTIFYTGSYNYEKNAVEITSDAIDVDMNH